MDKIQYESRRHDLAVAAPDIGWFPDRIEPATRLLLASICCQAHEIRISGLERQYARLESARVELKRCVAAWFALVGVDVFLFRCLNRPSGWNNLKSRRGLFWDAGPAAQPQATTLELERRGERILAGVLKISDVSFDFAWDHTAAMSNAVWVAPKSGTAVAPSRDLIEKLVDSLEKSGAVWIDYPKLVASCCKLGLSVLRGGGDGGPFVVGRGRDGGTFANVALFGQQDAVDAFTAYTKRNGGELI